MNIKRRIGILFLILILLIVPFFSAMFNIPKSISFSPFNAPASVPDSGTTGATSISSAFTANPAQNDFLTAEITTADGGTVNSVTDTLGNTFVQAICNTNTYLACIYIAKQNHTAGADTVTVNFAGTVHNATLLIQENAQITSTTASVTSSGHGTTANPISVASMTPNLNDACFSSAILRTSLTTAPIGVFALSGANGNQWDLIWQYRIASSEQIHFAQFTDYPLSATATLDQTDIRLVNNDFLATNVLWEIVTACFPQSQVTTTTTTTTTSVSTSTQGLIQAGDFSVLMLGALVIGFPLVFIFRRRIRRL